MCDLCGSPAGPMVMSKNNHSICEDPVACVGRARSFPWWRAREYVVKKS